MPFGTERLYVKDAFGIDGAAPDVMLRRRIVMKLVNDIDVVLQEFRQSFRHGESLAHNFKKITVADIRIDSTKNPFSFHHTHQGTGKF